MGNLAVNFTILLASLIVSVFSASILFLNAWLDNLTGMTSVNLICVITLSLLLASMMYGKVRAC
jgi:hypothetical protein